MNDSIVEVNDPINPACSPDRQIRVSPTSISKPTRPFEFSIGVAIPFTGLFIGLSVALGIIYSKAESNGRLLLITMMHYLNGY